MTSSSSCPPRCVVSPVDLAKLHLPYRLTTRAELNSLKSAGHLSIQAPSSMLMRMEDAVKLMREKGEDRIKKILRKKLHALSLPSANQRVKRRHRTPPPPHSHSAPTSPVTQGRIQPFLLTEEELQKEGETGKEGEETREGEGGEGEGEGEGGVVEGAEDDEDDDDDSLFSVSEVSVVSSHQFRVMWQQVATPGPSPPLIPTPLASLPPPSSHHPLHHSAVFKRKPRKSPCPFSLSYQLALEWQQRGEEEVQEADTSRGCYSEGDEEEVGWDAQKHWKRRRV